jgi:predicted TIM-barrel fold metal-dependent hydrolase
MGKGFEYKACDRAFYDKHLKDFLPDKMFDAHVHISTAGLSRYGSHNGGSTWTDYLCKEMGVEEFLAMNKEMFPNQKMEALIFGMCLTGINETNAYVINNNKDYGFPMLYRSDYAQSPDELEANVKAGGFIGLKPYLSNCPSYIPSNEVRIFDFLPPAQLEVANKNGWIIMLHIPRNKRLGDPVNIAQIMEIEEKYPNVKLIVAHVGRAYTDADFGNAFEILKNTKHMMFDFTANLFTPAITEGIKTVGVDRFLYGTDLPIAVMRMYRIVENGDYFNVVPKGYYGDVTGQPHMREEDNDQISLMAYEQLLAFKRSAAELKLTDTDVEKILYSNAKKLCDSMK